MTQADLPAFREMFEGLLFSGLSFTPPKDQREQALATYFQALESYSLPAVRKGYEKLQHGLAKFPAVSQWVQAMPRDGRGGEIPVMSHAQMRESDEAERLFYEGALCRCQLCEQAHVTHLPLRYVPRLDGNGDPVQQMHPRRNKPVIVGEWIHGGRLRTWYAAKAEFYQKLESLKPGVKQILETVEK